MMQRIPLFVISLGKYLFFVRSGAAQTQTVSVPCNPLVLGAGNVTYGTLNCNDGAPPFALPRGRTRPSL